MSTFMLYWLLILPGVKKVLIGIGGIGLVGALFGALITSFIGHCDDNEKAKETARKIFKKSGWFLIPILFAMFIPDEKIMAWLIGWELAQNVEGLKNIPGELVETLRGSLDALQATMGKVTAWME